MNLKKVLNIIHYFIIITVIITLIFISLQVRNIKNTLTNLSQQITIYHDNSVVNFSRLSKELKDTNESIKEVSNALENANNQEYLLLSLINEKSMDILKQQTSQYKETRKLEKVYSDLLTTEQNKTVSTSAYDITLVENRKKAKELYKQKEYELCYKLCDDILINEKDDLEIRFYRMNSLFLINKMDSSKYGFIMDECKVLLLNNYMIDEVKKIQDYIEGEWVKK